MTVTERGTPPGGVSRGAWGPIAALLFNAAVWGLSWWPFRQLQGLGVHPLWTTVFMYLLASACVLAVRPRAFAPLLREPALWVIALASGLTNAAFNWAVAIGDVVRVVLLFYLAPLWAVLLARWLLQERLGLGVGLRVVLALAGAALVLGPGAPDAAADAGAQTGAGALRLGLPDGLAIAGGMAFALINVMLRREAGRDSAERALAMFVGGSLVPGALCAAAAFSALPGAAALAWPVFHGGWVLPVLGLSVLFFVGNLALQYGAARLPAQVTAVVMPMEVVFASASAVAWGGAVLRWPMVAGGLLILSASLLSAWPAPRPAQRT